MTSPLQRPAEEREHLAEWLLDRLTPMMSGLGIIFVLVVLGEQLSSPGSAASTALTVVGWALWVVFVAEFVARLVLAPSTSRFLRRNWWQLIFILLPVLRVLRLVRALRVLRGGRVLSGAIRGSRSSASVLRGRLGWLASLWVIVVLAVSQLLHTFAAFDSYAASLHATALGAMTGEPLPAEGGVARVTEVLLAAVSVGLFGTLAASLGAYFLDSSRTEQGT
ncbi:hypothetical protein [Ornithinicoccus halotolerans]|uniref:hypothetical protein n=1 Tax=Ornithinicoccus halotolerans TaxID=1748220 RepID=UPI0012959642|nr:hypothetical protein [Ornithinicoccus halotolerans]